MNIAAINKTAQRLLASGKGILAADESIASATKRLAGIGVESSEETRRLYRELFFTAPGVENYLSGVILFDETIRQSASDGTPFRTLLASKGIVPGIKVDQGTVDFKGHPNEVVTKGLEGLDGRLDEYAKLGARFAKWRAVIAIGTHLPSEDALQENARILAEYAFACQQRNILPIIEPEVLLDGKHLLEDSEEVTIATVKTCFVALRDMRVALEGVILKTSMVVPGNKSGQRVDHASIADATVRMLKASVPKEVPGVVFLSGGQEPREAAENLNAIAKQEPFPWEIAFSFARALQQPALEVWRGKKENWDEAQKVFLQTLKDNTLADQGELE